MTPQAFVKLVGPQLLHVTPHANAASIAARGLLSAADLARDAGVNPDDLVLRKERRVLANDAGTVQLNHQLPLLSGQNSAVDFLDGHTLESWAAQLDGRIFFWPTRKGNAFAGSIKEETARYTLDSAAFFEAFAPRISLSPINSGNATRRPAKRGNWLYVPATAPVRTFRENRSRRGLIKGRDTVAEVSLSCPLPPDVLATLLQ